MAITVTDNRTLIDEGDSTTGWSSPVGGASLSLYTADPYPKETTGHIGAVVSNDEIEILHTHTSSDLSAGVLIYVWALPQGIMQTKANYGLAAVVGDGTNTNAYQVGGADASVFRHASGSSVNYQCMVVDTGSLPTGKALRGTFASLSLTAITEFGVDFVTTVKSVGGVENCFVDVIRYGNGGLTIIGTDSAAGFLDDLAVLDAALTTGQSYGGCRDLGGGIFGVQIKIILGDTGTGSDTLSIKDQTFKIENFSGVGTDKFGILIQGNATGTQTITFDNSILFSPVGSGAFLTASDVNVESFDITNCLIKNFDQSISLSTDATNGPNHDISNNNFVGCAQINFGKTAFKNNLIDSTVDANGGLIIDANSSLTNVTGLSFASDGTGHAIYITATGTYTFTNFLYSGYGADGTTDAVIYNNSGGAVTINVSGGNTPTVRNGTGASTTVVVDPVTFKVNVKDIETKANLSGVRVLSWVTDNANYFYQASVTITGSGTTATVAHTAHGMITGDKVEIKGANENEYNGAYSVTVTGVDSYTYTTNETIVTSPATGTIVSTFLLLSGTTDVNGDISDTRSLSANQAVLGRARLSSGANLYRQTTFSDIVDSSTGKTINLQLIPDD